MVMWGAFQLPHAYNVSVTVVNSLFHFVNLYYLQFLPLLAPYI